MTQHTILIVDDESVTRRLVSFALKNMNIETIDVEDATQAIQSAHDQLFELAIIDINLPDMDGFSLIKNLKQIPHMTHIPYIIFTARNNEDDTLLAKEVGAVGFLYKPFSTQELRNLVKQHLGI